MFQVQGGDEDSSNGSEETSEEDEVKTQLDITTIDDCVDHFQEKISAFKYHLKDFFSTVEQCASK